MRIRLDFGRTPTVLGVLLGLLSGCTYGGYIDQPVTIKFTWYSYLAGDDIRQACVPNSPPRYRLVYNGHYDEQIRSYEINARDGGGAAYKARVLGPARPLALITNPLDLQDPWRWTTSETVMGPAAFADFMTTLEGDVAARTSDGAKSLLSSEFYWIVSGCQDDRFFFAAWRYGDEDFAALEFPDTLLALDETGIALNPPRPIDPGDLVTTNRPAGSRASNRPKPFVVNVGSQGLVGLGG